MLTQGLTCRAPPTQPLPVIGTQPRPPHLKRPPPTPPAPQRGVCPDTSVPAAGNVYKQKLASIHLSRAMEPF